ncbi:MAG TPA: HAMP domain-containing sensor histidine kinase [Blastocatellia bacterium]|nr:HAMP domain-containing sensor histidine kinase [Blastocatellia bacterium]
MIVLVVALVALLPLLAVLQYRWVGQVAQAEKDRMHASLEAAVNDFAREFDREITRAYMDLQIDVATPVSIAGTQQDAAFNKLREIATTYLSRDRFVQSYGEKYDRWLADARHPELVRDIYLVEPGRKISCYNRASRQLELSDWPATLAPYRDRFEQSLAASLKDVLPSRGLEVETLSEDIPALVIPIPQIRLLGSDRLRLALPAPEVSFRGFVIVLLDLDFIRQTILPELAAESFAAAASDYRLAVVSIKDGDNVIFRSDSSLQPDPNSADASARLFNVSFPMPKLIAEAKKAALLNRDDAKESGGSVPGRLAVEVIKGQTAQLGYKVEDKKFNAHITLVGGDGGRWQVLATHRAGSLDAAVRKLRARNLGISFGILLLLSVSVALIIVSTRQANRLAQQQIEFVAGVSHELRTPLAVIRSAAENLADGVVDERNQVRRYGELIENEGRRLSQMVEQTLEFAGIQSGRRTYNLQPTPIADVVDDAIAASNSIIAEHDFVLDKHIDSTLPLVAADAPALSRAIQNLISNAIKYGGDSRRVRITAGNENSATGHVVRIAVEDGGLGIEPSELSRVFEPFYRGRDALAAQIHGNGLGLSLVRYIVQSHGGTVHVESTPGSGSCFSILIPAASRVVAEPAQS